MSVRRIYSCDRCKRSENCYSLKLPKDWGKFTNDLGPRFFPDFDLCSSCIDKLDTWLKTDAMPEPVDG